MVYSDCPQDTGENGLATTCPHWRAEPRFLSLHFGVGHVPVTSFREFLGEGRVLCLRPRDTMSPSMSGRRLTVDVVIFSVVEGELKVLLIKRKNWPFGGCGLSLMVLWR